MEDAEAAAGRKYGGYCMEVVSGIMGMLSDTIGDSKEGCEVRLERSIDVRGDNGETVF